MEKTLKPYEIGYLVKSEEGARTLIDHLKRQGAEILFEGEIKGIKLSYPIRRLPEAYFGYAHFKINPEVISGLSDALGLDGEIVRFLIVTPPFAKDKSFRPVSEPAQPRRAARPRAEPSKEIAASNDLLEEKLEEILR